MKPNETGRRRFLKNGAALAGLAVGAMRPAHAETPAAEGTATPAADIHAYGQRSHFENSIRRGAGGLYDAAPPDYHRDFGLRTPTQDSVGIITPASLHFYIGH